MCCGSTNGVDGCAVGPLTVWTDVLWVHYRCGRMCCGFTNVVDGCAVGPLSLWTDVLWVH
eukprot:1184644-Prorocentrum_minimum.AAC.1